MECFVPGCKSGYGRGREKIPLFAAPSNPQLLDQWRQKVPVSKRPLKSKDKICARHFEKHLIFDRYFSEHKGNVLLDVKKVPRLRKGAIPSIFEGITAKVNDADYQEEPADMCTGAEGREDIALPTTAYSAGAFLCPDNENSRRCLREDSVGWSPDRDLLSKGSSLSAPTKEECAPESGASSSTAMSDNKDSLCPDRRSLLQELIQHPERVKLPASWGYHKCTECKRLAGTLRCHAMRQRNRMDASGTAAVQPTIRNPKFDVLRRRQRLLYKKVWSSRRRLRELKNELKVYQERMSNIGEEELESLLQRLPEGQRIVVEECIKLDTCISSKGRRYSDTFLTMCLLLHIRSPAAYEFLRRNDLMPLPAVSTVRQGRDVNARTFSYIGQVQHDDTSEPPLADHALVFMFVPFADSYTQPVGVFASRGPTKGTCSSWLKLIKPPKYGNCEITEGEEKPCLTVEDIKSIFASSETSEAKIGNLTAKLDGLIKTDLWESNEGKKQECPFTRYRRTRSYVQSTASFVSSGSIIRSGETSSTSSTSASAAVNLAQHLLHELCASTKPFLPTTDVLAVSLVAGYISRVVNEKSDCERCVSLVLKAKGSSTSATDGLISHQDRGGLCYPTPELVRVRIHALKRFVEAMLLDRVSLHKPLETTPPTATGLVSFSIHLFRTRALLLLLLLLNESGRTHVRLQRVCASVCVKGKGSIVYRNRVSPSKVEVHDTIGSCAWNMEAPATLPRVFNDAAR
ncbi:hypothetical protein HPB52_024061 [Rhipicephalus sanguineus]|uniref:THAP-type domain-containing protein n=1 Tax=Rhipicephalus sanguineus TaxID=34632 RepID=A0A9D4Q8Z1_RHISA|nr:hypothetical protein HPB52_024061 [Rhipicephalus sanguineus]